ncbi:hypothetical protein Abiwalacus_06070 [Akkermansia biwaensis]|uniref:Uncharacterized protein n=1 Tax=Akkermansia biwaensis TaxID=2946555 RepID=A0ABN6QFP2_9BACT|nr:hypothetical protein Abiwalacus_06070 [Akkermansia biwaensis]
MLTGCGGSSKTEEIYLPVGTARNVTVNLENGRSFVIGFNVISAQNAYIYSGESGSPSSASMHVRGYVPADDTASEISFYWYTNRDGAEAFPCYLVMTNVQNVTKGTGSATCAVSDIYFADPAVTDRPGTLTRFNLPN